MIQGAVGRLAAVMSSDENEILREWLGLLGTGEGGDGGRIRSAELEAQAKTVLRQLREGLEAGEVDRAASSFEPLRATLADLAQSRAQQGFSPTDIATFVFSLKEPIFTALGRACADDARGLAAESWSVTKLVDQLGLYTMEVFQNSREAVIGRQSTELAELSTPVVKLWDGILALPLIGTLDSGRTSVVMETLLQAIVENAAEIAIIDITGVPTVDTLVAQYLLKTIAAARMMGADCIISGIRPQIAQTMVHLGVELKVVSKATLADALALALRRTGRAVVHRTAPAPDRAE